MDAKQLRESALYYHREPKPGKIAVTPIKQFTNQYDLSLAYSPGVAFACEEIVADPRERMKTTVFHDDQHGTAIVVGAAVPNGLHLIGKDLSTVKIVTAGAGAADC